MPADKFLDLERCMTLSIKQDTTSQPSLSSEAARSCAIAVQHLDGGAILINVNIKEEVDGDIVLNPVKRQILQALSQSWHQKLAGKLLMGFLVGTARIKQVQQMSSGRRWYEFITLTYQISPRR